MEEASIQPLQRSHLLQKSPAAQSPRCKPTSPCLAEMTAGSSSPYSSSLCLCSSSFPFRECRLLLRLRRRHQFPVQSWSSYQRPFPASGGGFQASLVLYPMNCLRTAHPGTYGPFCFMSSSFALGGLLQADPPSSAETLSSLTPGVKLEILACSLHICCASI